MNRLDVEPTQIGNPSGYAPVRDVMNRNKSQIKRNIEACGLNALDYSEFMNVAGVGEILAEIDPLHHGLGLYAATGQGLRGIVKRLDKYLDAHDFTDAGGEEGGAFTPQAYVALIGMEIKALEALGETATNILTARSKLKTKPREGATMGRITLDIRGAEPAPEKAIDVTPD